MTAQLKNRFYPEFEALETRDLMDAGLKLALVSPLIDMKHHAAETRQAVTRHTSQVDIIHAIAGKPWSGVVVKFHQAGGTIYFDSAFKVVINWGDGTPPTEGSARLVKLEPGPKGLDGTFEVLASHTYARPGTYDIKVSVDAQNFHVDVPGLASVIKGPSQTELLPGADGKGQAVGSERQQRVSPPLQSGAMIRAIDAVFTDRMTARSTGTQHTQSLSPWHALDAYHSQVTAAGIMNSESELP
jgi:hypothetical protein